MGKAGWKTTNLHIENIWSFDFFCFSFDLQKDLITNLPRLAYALIYTNLYLFCWNSNQDVM